MGLLWEKRGRKCSRLLPCVFSGQCGRKEIVGCLKMGVIRFNGVNFIFFVTFERELRGF